MITILRQYIEGDMQVTEYTQDGQSVSHVVKVPVHAEIPAGEQIPVPPTFEQRLSAVEDAITALLGL
ncbi:hypothetical protein [Parageobacillus sp. KH3-4]|uniref:hypothetical protein n=1 Tax=Parageobacillus sp. KH3-4 TaxID=2916802 RepID=UPI001FCA9216|nr:hypothetical protein [Parageobacillus sp. KH3-4]BDG48761.1 hypothetical protein PspKH34_33220 [Parageobacillus sp. KH3-4]